MATTRTIAELRALCTCKEGPHRVPWLFDNACDKTCGLRDPKCVLHGDALTREAMELDIALTVESGWRRY